MKIESARIINDIIEGNKRQYSIPVYQRNYEWSHEQCVKLFKDIISSYKSDKKHFCGSIVEAPLKEEHHFNYYVIIDGQQRLTTIYLLLKALMDKAEDEKTRESIADTIFNKDKFDDYGIDDASKLKLKPIKTDNQQLLYLMDGKFDLIDKTSSIWHNYELFSTLIEEQLENGLFIKDIYNGIGNLTCAQIKLEAEDNAQEIFERINSTGVPLSLADKIRNYALMTDVNQEYLFENYWLKIETGIGKDYLTSFFLDFINSKMDGFTKENEAYDNFKALYENACSKEEMLKEVLRYAEFYHAFLYGNPKYGDKVNSVLSSIQKLKQTTCFMFLFHVFDDYENAVIPLSELEKLLQFILNYSIRRMVCEVPSNSLRGLYKTLYARAFANVENKKTYYDTLVSFFMQLTTKDAIPDDDKFVVALKDNNLYRKFALCKYLLSVLENQGKEKIETSNLSIEHIMPQNSRLSTSWQNMLGSEWKTIQERYLHTLGNLTLTGYNSELGDKPFEEKKRLIDDANSKVVFLYSDVKDKDEWNETAIKSRAERLARTVVGLYPIEKPATLVEFKDTRYTEYTCEIPDNATYKTPNYYILQGEQVSVNTYSDMLKSACERFYEIDPTIIETMAKNNETLFKNSTRPMFSYDKNVLNGTDCKIRNTDIYEDSGFSASYIMWIIKALLEKYEIDINDFVYSAKPANKAAAFNFLDYWTKLADYAYSKVEFSSVFSERKPSTQGFFGLSVGVGQCSVNFYVRPLRKVIGVDFYVDGNKDLFHDLLGKKDEIEKDLSFTLLVKEAAKDGRFYLEMDADLTDETKFQEYFDWYVEKAVKLKRIVEFING